MSAPKFVNTSDGTCWTRREESRGGEALYAPEKCGVCPEFVMATYAELEAHGVVGTADVLPVPVGPQSQPVDDDLAKAPWGRGEDGRPLLGPGAHWTDVPEVVDQELARIQGRVDQAQSGHWYVASDTEAWRPAGTVRTNVDGYQRTVGQCTNMRAADLDLVLHAHDDLSWCLEMVAKFRTRVAELEHTVQQMVEGLNSHDCPPPNEAPLDTVTRWMGYLGAAEARVAELEAERHSTNEALDDAVRELRARPSCPCPPEGRPHRVGCPQAEVPVSERPVNGLTSTFAPVAALREVADGEHYAHVHRSYLKGHDLELGGGA